MRKKMAFVSLDAKLCDKVLNSIPLSFKLNFCSINQSILNVICENQMFSLIDNKCDELIFKTIVSCAENYDVLSICYDDYMRENVSQVLKDFKIIYLKTNTTSDAINNLVFEERDKYLCEIASIVINVDDDETYKKSCIDILKECCDD